jgi:1-acyl-sn-glycerol-3-phosphate acyltransferase
MSTLRPWIKLSIVFLALAWYLGQLMLISAIRGKVVERGFRFRRKFCTSAISILGIKYQHSGFACKGSCLYVSNHRSMLDPLIQLAHIDAFIVSKAEVGSYPLLGLGAQETGIILVDRHDQRSRKSALAAIEAKLLEGYPVLIYPEGTTNGGDLTAEFRRGAIELAHQRGIPVVPVMIEYPDTSYYWKDTPLMTYFTSLFSRSGKHEVHGKIGTPMNNTSPDTLVEDIRASVDAMIIETRLARSIP